MPLHASWLPSNTKKVFFFFSYGKYLCGWYVDMMLPIWSFHRSTALRLSYRLTDWCDNREIPFCLSIAGNDQSVQVKCSRSLPEFIAVSVPGCVNEVKVNLSAISKWIKGDLQVRRQSNEDNSETVQTSSYIVNIHSTSLYHWTLRLQLCFWNPPMYSSSTAPPSWI